MLKLGVPCPELRSEAAALKLFKGEGAVRLLDHDARRGILVMERVVPGTPIYKLQGDLEATRTAAGLMQQLWRSPPARHSFPSLAVWFQALERLRKRFAGGTGPFPLKLIEQAELTSAQLNVSTTHTVILHGDLHHENILRSGKESWLAIDPKGVCGEVGYEVGPFMLNQLPIGLSESAKREILKQRLAVFSDELRIPGERLGRWSFCYSVLSALWNFEESADWRPTIKLARVLRKLS